MSLLLLARQQREDTALGFEIKPNDMLMTNVQSKLD